MFEVAIQMDCTTRETAEVLMAAISRALRGDMSLAPGTGCHLLAETLTEVPRARA